MRKTFGSPSKGLFLCSLRTCPSLFVDRILRRFKKFLFLLYFFVSLWYTCFMKYDYVTLYNKTAAFLEARPKAKKGILLFNAYIPYFFLVAYALLFVYGAFKGKFEATDFVKIFCAPAFALLLVTVLRLAIDRPRPYDEEGAGIVPLKKKEGDKNSFPSRHLTCAAVIAAAFLPYLPAVSALLFIFSVGLGYARFAVGWHYPSDLFAGFALGLVIGIVPILL